MLLKRYAPQLRFIIIGDYEQLPPFCDEYSGNYSESVALKGLCDFSARALAAECELMTYRRGDKKVAELFDRVRHEQPIDTAAFPMKQLTRMNLAYCHTTRQRVNQQCTEVFREAFKANPSSLVTRES